MASSASGKQKQDDLRRLMKERRENLKGDEKIDSPFAKYNNIGQLLCTVCNVHVKKNSLWMSHIAGKNHKENVVKKKKSTTDVQKNVNSGLKRTAEQIKNGKRVKLFAEPEPVKETGTVKDSSNIALLEGYSSSEDENENSDAQCLFPPENDKIVQQSLPKDFFDEPSSSEILTNNKMTSDKLTTETPVQNNDALPEGFFDDPILDAKARNIEYKDPVEEEWEKFQKTIAEETNVSKTIMEEDLEESTLERNIMQIDEQIYQWERSNNLQCLADKGKTKAPLKDENMNESDSADEDLADDDLLDWRSKGVKKL